MKKKFWALVLSIVLAIGVCVPTLAMDFTSSSESGDSSEITQLAFKNTSYTISQDQTFDLSKEVIAYCGTKKICQYPNLVFSTDDTNMVFNVDENGSVTVFESSGSATVTVKEQDSGKKATCRVVASKGGEASGLKFSTSSVSYVKGVSASEQPTFMIEPTGGAYFSSTQISEIETAINDNLTCGVFEVKAIEDDLDGKLLVTPTSISEPSVNKKTYTISFLLSRSSSSTPSKKNVSLTCNFVSGNEARVVGRKGAIKLEIGKTVDLNDYVTYNSSANYGKKCTFTTDLYSSKYNTSDYAVLGDDGKTLMGVAVGKLNVIARLDGSGAEVTIPVDVVAKNGSNSNTSSDSSNSSNISISPSSGSIRVGSTMLLTAKNADSGSEISWSTNDSSILSLTESGTKVTVKGVKVGTAKVTCEVDGEEIGTVNVTVSNVGSSNEDESLDGSGNSSSSGSGGTTVLPTPPIVINPATCDNWFSFLF